MNSRDTTPDANRDPISGAPGPADYAAYAGALRQAYQRRLDTMGDDGEVPAAPGCTAP